MDLDDLKYQLKDKLASAHAGLSSGDLTALLRKRTISITDKLKRNLWIEIICCIVVVFGFGAVALFSPYPGFRLYFSVFTILCAVFLIILVYLLRRTSRLSATDLPVKNNLQEIVKLIEEFMRRYFQFTMALLPICFFFALMIGYNDRQPMPSFFEKYSLKSTHAKWITIILLVVYLGGLFFGMYYFTRWYLRKQFGRYVAQLKECIAELGE